MKTKLIILLLLSICFSSCTQCLTDDKGIVTRIELSDKEGTFNVYLREIDNTSLYQNACFDFPKTFYFKTSTLYHVGDTIHFQNNENN